MIVGRARELSVLEQVLDEASAGTPARILMVGEAGIGAYRKLGVTNRTALADRLREAG